MILLIQTFSLVFYIGAFFWIINAYMQILKRNGAYYLAVKKMGGWVPVFLKYATPILLVVFFLQIIYISTHLVKSLF